MKSRVTVLGHPVHPMLIVFPLGLLSTAVVFDVIHVVDRNGEWSVVAFYMIGAGIVFGVIAASVGLVDWLALPNGSRAKQIGLMHALSNAFALVLFIVSWFMRRDTPAEPSGTAFLLGAAGLFAATVGGWLGGELVYRLGIGVDADPRTVQTTVPRRTSDSAVGE